MHIWNHDFLVLIFQNLPLHVHFSICQEDIHLQLQCRQLLFSIAAYSKIPNKKMCSFFSDYKFYSINIAGLNGLAVRALFLGSYFWASDSPNTCTSTPNSFCTRELISKRIFFSSTRPDFALDSLVSTGSDNISLTVFFTKSGSFFTFSVSLSAIRDFIRAPIFISPLITFERIFWYAFVFHESEV